jgi:predicted RNA polymerase sigma factor
MLHGPRTGVAELAAAETDPALAGHYRIDAVRAHVLELAGERDSARTHYQQAARPTLSVPEQRYLQSRAARI